MGHRFQTPRWYKYTKSVEPYLCLFFVSRFWNTYPIRISKQRPRRIWNATKQSSPQRMLCGGIVISQRAFTAFLLWIGWNFPDFDTPKQALINAFYNMSANFWFATAKVRKKMYMCKKSCFFVVFKVSSSLIKFQSTASDVLGIVHLLCVYCPSIVRE